MGTQCARVLAVGAALGVLLIAGVAQANRPALVAQGGSGRVKFDPAFVRKNPEFAGRVARFGLVNYTTRQVAVIDAARVKHSIPLPYWTTTVTSPIDKMTYSYDMVGSTPYSNKKLRKSVVTVQPIIVKLTVTDPTNGNVLETLDPTVPSPCDSNVSVEDRWLQSPLFQPAAFNSNAVNMGITTLPDAFQRANFWQNAKGTNFGIRFNMQTPVVVSLSEPGRLKQGTCGNNLAVVDINKFSGDIQNISRQYANPNEVALILTYNVLESDGLAETYDYTIGFHAAVSTDTGVQTYATGSCFDEGFFVNYSDVAAWSHELIEWLDDPFGRNVTPAWGHTGQVDGCYNQLEVGDPLTGTYFDMPTPSGVTDFVYHQQDLAFHDWFFGTPSTATGGRYSFRGTFNSTENAPCTASNATTASNSKTASARGNLTSSR